MLQFFDTEEFRELEKAVLALAEALRKDISEYMKNHDIFKEGETNK